MTLPHRTVVVPGNGIIVRWPNAVVVIGGDDDVVATCIADLRDERDEPPAAGRLIEQLRVIDSLAIAAAVVTPAGLRLLSHGGGRVDLLTDEADGSDPERPAAAEYDVDVTSSPVWIGIGAAPPDRSDHALLDLEAGIVPGRGVILDARHATPTPAAAPQPFQIVDLGTPDVIERAALPVATQAEAPAPVGPDIDDSDDIVMGIVCSRNHFNNPIAAYCQVCGISMVHLTHHLVPGSRPTLGYIVFDNGATYALDRPYLIGREPAPEPGSTLEALIADDLDHTVSREHAELTFDGWDVVIADLGSTNGTFRWDPATGRWERIMANHPAVIAPGVSVALGHKTFVYETVARSV